MTKTSNISDFLKYKKAKIIVKDLEVLNKKLSGIYQELYPYKKYVPVRELLKTVTDSKTIISLHLKKNKTIVNNKGIDEEV
jgi:hypothetical protein